MEASNNVIAYIRRSSMAALALVAATAGPWSVAHAAPMATRIIDGIALTTEGHCSVITLTFLLPLQYIRHFPDSYGDEVLVRVEPLETGRVDNDALSAREAVRPQPPVDTPLVMAIYEGDIADGPYVRFQFEHPVNFSVSQGTDFRSLIVTVADTGQDGGAPACGSEPPPLPQPLSVLYEEQ